MYNLTKEDNVRLLVAIGENTNEIFMGRYVWMS